MQLFSDTHIDFMKYRRLFVALSAASVLLSLFLVVVHGKLNLGIDFAGGTQLTLKMAQEPDVEALRREIAAAGVAEAQLQRFGDVDAGEVMIKTPTVSGSEEGSRAEITAALDAYLNGGGEERFDLNLNGTEALTAFLLEHDPEQLAVNDPVAAEARYQEAASAILAARRETGLLTDWSQIESQQAVGPTIAASLRANAELGAFSVLGAENVGPLIGKELRRKGVLAVVLSLVGMLIYIWFRFELRFGIGALVAVTHDVIITLGLFALADFEFNLTTIAAFLTLVGYSVNDTVVVFDRVRENLRRKRSRPLIETLNVSLNQTLSRTVLTSGTTLLTCGCLLFFGGDVLRGFAFILTIGIVVGTYSSIYVASPFTELWERLLGREARTRRREARTA